MADGVDVVILAGGPRRGSTAAAIGRPIWDLPVAPSCSVLDGWLQVLALGFESVRGLRLLSSVVLVSNEAVAHSTTSTIQSTRIKPELRSHRGTAGVVADELASRDRGDDGLVLVIQASSSPVIRIRSLLERIEAGFDDDCWGIIGESELGRFCGLILCRRKMFDLVPAVGFYDLKEQLLPSLASSSACLDAVCVADRARSMQTREGWLSIASEWASMDLEMQGSTEFPAASGRIEGQGSVIQPSAETRGATLVSSVVMDHAVIEPGAVVARSIIGPGTRVKAGSRVVDAIVADPKVSQEIMRAAEMSAGEEASPCIE